MIAHIDWVTLTLNFDASAETVIGLVKQLFLGKERDQRLRAFEAVYNHELSHLLSFLGSPLSHLHYGIISTQKQLLHEVLCEARITGSTEHLFVPTYGPDGVITGYSDNICVPVSNLRGEVVGYTRHLSIPLFNQDGSLLPNICPSGDAEAVQQRRRDWRLLEKLRGFFLTYCPQARVEELQQGRALVARAMGFEQAPAPFLRADLAEWVRHDFAPSAGGAALPILPHFDPTSEKAARISTIASNNVIEGLAVIAELLHALYRREEDRDYGIRDKIPFPYTVGLRYALSCINKAQGTAYSYDDIISGSLPLEVVVTLAGIFDLALQVPVIKYAWKESLCELCPGWRLYLLGKMIAERRFPLLENISPDDTRGDFHDWQAYALECMDWSPVEVFGIFAASKLVNQYATSDKVNAGNLFDYLSSLGQVYRTRNEIAYIQQIIRPRGDEWLNFVGYRTNDGNFIPTHGEICSDFFRVWDRNYYRLAACIFGTYWDKWWAEYPQETLDEVTEWIWHTLGAVSGIYAREQQSRQLMQRKFEILAHQIQIRPEYDRECWRR